MILRKPYAFLIKHFRSINFLILLLSTFLLFRTLNLYSFVKDYLATGIYNVTLNPISNYINGYLYIAFILMIGISLILTILLKKKEKPFIVYIYIILVGLVSLILSLYINNYFIYTVSEGFNQQLIRLIRDFVLIDSFLYYPILVLLIIRSLGIDLKSFGFQEDKEYLEISENDREEVEVQVEFNKDKYIRLIKNKIRYTKYFFLEHFIPITIILVLVLLVGVYNVYHYVYVENKIYSENETFTSNYFQISINNTYLTDKDYAGNVITSTNRFFIVVDLSIKNLSVTRNFDASKLFLYVDDDYYVPTTRYNLSFVDMGNLYTTDAQIGNQDSKNFILVYEVDKPNEDANFLLKYQDLISEDKKMIRIKIKVRDITSFKERDTANFNETLIVPTNETTSYSFEISDYYLTDTMNYTYESCYLHSCPIYEGTLVASTNKKILSFRFDSETSANNFLTFLKRYGKLYYTVGEMEYIENLSFKITKYRGKYVYLEVPSILEQASMIRLGFTVRTNQYFYQLKG